MSGSIAVFLPIQTVNESNNRDHWSVRARRTKLARCLARMLLGASARLGTGQGAKITLTRVGPRELDGDGCCSALKATRDGVADALGVDDGSPLLEWVYLQRKAPKAQAGVMVVIEPRKAP